MKSLLILLPLVCLFVACGRPAQTAPPAALASPTPSRPSVSLLRARQGFTTKLLRREVVGEAAPVPPANLFSVVHYKSPAGFLSAYISKPAKPSGNAAIIWIVGGFSNSISEIAWTPGPPENDQSASTLRTAGIVTMYPSLRGGNDNPGYMENFYGELDDVLGAADYLAKYAGVDPNRIYLGGHSTGGTLALLAAEARPEFRAVFALGPVGNVAGYGQDALVFNVKDPMEVKLRSPIHYLQSIHCPTFVFEGATGQPSNIRSLLNLQSAPHSSSVSFYPMNGFNHFTLIRPLLDLIARKINADTGTTCNISFSAADLGTLKSGEPAHD